MRPMSVEEYLAAVEAHKAAIGWDKPPMVWTEPVAPSSGCVFKDINTPCPLDECGVCAPKGDAPEPRSDTQGE